MKVKAMGMSDVWVGFYHHVRRRGGDVFSLLDPKDFSTRWMEVVPETLPDTTPAHFNAFGGGQPSRTKGDEAAGSSSNDSVI